MTTCNKICRFCKHWSAYSEDYRETATYPQNCNVLKKTLDITLDQGSGWDAGGASVEEVCTPGDFGCNKWEHFKA